ncbi:MAG TPA: VOC family protein [Blastocatellia bacterium]|nr:VOC family protein [Blastocatellia bacterium]
MSRSENLVPAKNAVDHLLLGAADLDRGINWLESLTGVKATIGGSHPGRGTRNALISLGGRQYLEIIAPDPAQSSFNFDIDIRKLAEPRLITWAAATTDINTVAKTAREAGYQVFGPRDGSRTRPDGRMLRWKTLGVPNRFGAEPIAPIPFFIEWAKDSLHPSQDSAKGCELLEFEFEHTDSAGVTDMLKKLGIEAKVKQAKEARLRATLKTPKGKVNLS